MARAPSDNLHSRVVLWLKILLPLGALAGLSSLFLVSNVIDPADAIPYAKVDVAERVREPRMTEPAYAGVTRDGSALRLTAAEARSPTETTIPRAKALTGSLETRDGTRTDLRADAGEIDRPNNRMILEGNVEVTNSTGWTITTPRMTGALDRTLLDADGPVAADGPPGKLTAEHMRMTPNPADPVRYLLVFNGRVKLVYVPD